jgi:hypothetical protein
MIDRLKLDKRGKIITQPVTGYALSHLAGIGVLLSVDYVDNPRKLETGEPRRAQLALTAKKAQQLGESLNRGRRLQMSMVTRRTLAIEALQRRQEARQLKRFLEIKNQRELNSSAESQVNETTEREQPSGALGLRVVRSS